MNRLEVRLYAARNLPILTNLGTTSIPALVTSFRTSTISSQRSLLPRPKAINPVWNQTLNFVVEDPNNQFLYLQFIDTDDNEQKTKMGEVWVPLAGLGKGVEMEKWYPLQNATRGEVRVGVIAHYDTSVSFPLSTPNVQMANTSFLPQANTSSPQISLVNPQSLPLSPQMVPVSQSPSLSRPMTPLSQPMSQPPVQPLVPPITPPLQIPPLVQPPQASSHLTPPQKPSRPQGLINFRPEDLNREFPHIAKGSFGVVFKGHAKGFSEVVVIKDLEIQSSKSVDEWRKEISLMSTVKSPFVVEVFGFCSNQKILTIVMEYMVNGDLYQLLHKNSHMHPLSMLQRMRMARHCAMGLSVLHTQSIIHRDVKSMNILVSEDYSCKLTDFGCSKLVSDRQVYNTINSGTPLWMAPEVKRGQYSLPADIYSLGLVLFEIFERKLPSYDQNRQIVILPKTFQSASIVMPCLNPVPERRPTIHHVVKVLDKMINDVVTLVRTLLPQHEQEKIQQEIQMRVLEGKDVELEVAYRHLLSKSPNEVDDLIKRAFKVDIEPQHLPKPPPITTPIQPNQNRFNPLPGGRFGLPQQQPPYAAPSYNAGMNMQPMSFSTPPTMLDKPNFSNFNNYSAASGGSAFENTKQQAINSFLAYKEEGTNEVHKNWCTEILSELLRNRMNDDVVKMTAGNLLNKDTVGLNQFLTVYKQLLDMCDSP